MIIVIRHAQSEGNQNRQIHQTVPDHRVKLTDEGWKQAREAGRRLRSLLKPSDTLRFYTSPYRRTRETTDGILQTLTSDEPDPSPFPRHTIKVWEEPRLREQLVDTKREGRPYSLMASQRFRQLSAKFSRDGANVERESRIWPFLLSYSQRGKCSRRVRPYKRF